MISQKQIQANRISALRSTGPKTAAGKAVVARNALRHGLRARQVVLDSESREEFEEFHELLTDQLAPATRDPSADQAQTPDFHKMFFDI